jgi:hypothetical protein
MRLLTFLLLASSLSGCYKQTFTFDGSNARPSTSADVKKWHSAVLWGLIEIGTVDAKAACGGKQVVAVGGSRNVWQSILTSITYGIYAPVTMKVWCGGGAASFEVPVDGIGSTDAAAAMLLDVQDRQSEFLSR